MTERYINGVRIDQNTWDKVKAVQEEMEKRPRRRLNLRLRRRR